MKIPLIAGKRLRRYAGVKLQPGDIFEAKRRDARVLVALKLATDAGLAVPSLLASNAENAVGSEVADFLKNMTAEVEDFGETEVLAEVAPTDSDSADSETEVVSDHPSEIEPIAVDAAFAPRRRGRPRKNSGA